MNRFYLILLPVLTLIITINPLLVMADTQHTQVGRYINYTNKPLPEQKNLMLQTVQTIFPPSVKTVGQAIEYILRNSGYTLAPLDKAAPEAKKLFAMNLPIVDRNFGPMTLQDALKTLVGDSFGLRIDRLNRQVSFCLNQ